MKRSTALVIALVMALSLSACGGKEDGSAAVVDVTTSTAETVEDKPEEAETEKEETEDPEKTTMEETAATEPSYIIVEATAEDFEYQYDSVLKGIIIKRYIGEYEAIRIPANIDGEPVVQFKMGTNSKLKYVEISDGITTISKEAFKECSKLENVKIPDSVTRICEDAFDRCMNLTTFKVPDTVVEFGYWEDKQGKSGFGASVFGYCKNLTKVEMPQRLEQEWFGGFKSCTSLKEITIPEGVTKIAGNGAFSGCESLENIIIPDWIVTIGDYAFHRCENLKEIVLPDSVTYIGSYAFMNCKNLKKITIPSTVTHIGDSAFDDCISLRNLTLPDNIEKVYLGAMSTFGGCDALTVTYRGQEYNHENDWEDLAKDVEENNK